MSSLARHAALVPFVLAVLLVLAPSLRAAAPQSDTDEDDGPSHYYEGIGVLVDLRGVEILPYDGPNESVWCTTIAGTVVELNAIQQLIDPRSAQEVLRIATSGVKSEVGDVEVLEQEVVKGAYGRSGDGALVHLRRYVEGARDEVEADVFLLAGLGAENNWLFRAESRGPLSKGGIALTKKFLTTRITCDAPPRDTEWTEEELAARIERDVPASVSRQRIRTTRGKHFVVVGDGAAVQRVLGMLEDSYDTFVKTLDVEVEGSRMLLPAYFFESRSDFDEFCRLQGVFGAPSTQFGLTCAHDWIALHAGVEKGSQFEFFAASNLVRNVAFYDGAGDWLYFGIASHISAVTDPAVRRMHLDLGERARRDGRFVPFSDLFRRDRIGEQAGGDAASGMTAGDVVVQAGTVVEAVLHSKSTKKDASLFFLKMGMCPLHAPERVESELRRLWGVDVEGFEALWLQYLDKPAKKI
ncbi:MAG: hypothetical protein R3F34_16075 [Planctomycetota bacterium]